jgi:hypothetical protein
VSLTFHSVLRKLNTEPSIGTSHQILVHFGKAVSEVQTWPPQAILVSDWLISRKTSPLLEERQLLSKLLKER